MQKGRMLLLGILVLGLCAPWACAQGTNIVYTLSGTLVANLNGGPDCLGGLNSTAVATATANSAQAPVATTGNSATYRLPAGAVTATVGTITFTSTAPWSMKYILTKSNQYLLFAGPGPLGSTVQALSTLVAGSFPKTVLGTSGHPRPLNPADSPENLTSPSSYLTYSVPPLGCSATKLGFDGTISSNPK
jgi:hypothetical protein